MSNRLRFAILVALLAASLILAAAYAAAAPPAAQDDSGPPPEGLAEGGRPLALVDRVVMPRVDVAALLIEDRERFLNGQPPRFALPIAVDISPRNYGTWEDLPDGRALWRLRIAAPGALSLNLGFTRYVMPEGGRLFLYSSDYGIVRGPFTAGDNESHGQLWSPILTAEEIAIEVSLPAAAVSGLELRLTSVNHGYVPFGTVPEAVLSGSCNLDVVCGAADGFPQVEAWRDQIRSVAVISTGGSTFCTGFLVNNTAQDLTPYFMTANHCGINSGNAASLVAYWNYENSWCRPPGSPQSGQPGDGTLNQFNTGSFWRSSYSPSDFTLVELDDPIDQAFDVHWAGWDATSGDTNSAVAIHHPSTDEKRISFEDDPTATTSYLGNSTPGDGTHLRILDWDLGTTEPGSSGSPLFSPGGHVVGQLHGGYAACGNDLSDWYGRFSVSWNGGGAASSRLKDWLDPGSTGALVLDGRDEAADFGLVPTPSTAQVCIPSDAVYNIDVTSQSGFSDSVILSASGHPAGTTTGFNPNPVSPPGSSQLTIGNTGAAAAGNYSVDIIGMAPTRTHTVTVGLDLFATAPAVAPTLLSPANGATGVSPSPEFTWTGVANAGSYLLEVATDGGMSTIVYTATVTGTSHTAQNSLAPETEYFWRVTPQNPCGAGTGSAVFSFTTASVSCRQPNLPIPDSNSTGVTDSMSVTGTGQLDDLNVSIEATHTWVGDLVFTLRHVDTGTSVTLIDRPGYTGSGFGCGENDVGATLDDEGLDGPVENQCSPSPPALFGSPTPNNPLSAFDGEDLNGTWELNVSDRAGGDTGTLDEWCLIPSSSGTGYSEMIFLPAVFSPPGTTAQSLPAAGLVLLPAAALVGMQPFWRRRRGIVLVRARDDTPIRD